MSLTHKKNPIEKTIYNTCYDAVSTIRVFDSNVNLINSATAFTVCVLKGRIFVLTCAHVILTNYSEPNSGIYPIITALVKGAYQLGSKTKNKRPVAVSLKVLGMNVSADVALLCSILPGEETNFSLLSYLFGNKTQILHWANRTILYGEIIYALGNMYGGNTSMFSGNCVDNNLIYLSGSDTYLNNIQQIATTLSVSEGVSGGPIICYDPKNKRGAICGIAQLVKIDTNYTCGLDEFSLYNTYKRLFHLNVKCNSITRNLLNFNGSTRKGYSGVSTYEQVNAFVLTVLNSRFSRFNESKYNNRAQGILITSFSDTKIVIPDSRVVNAVNICKKDYLRRNKNANSIGTDKVEVGNIITEINSEVLGDEGQDLRISDKFYYSAGGIFFIKCLRPENVKVQYYKCIADEYPQELEFVSQDSSIRLIADSKIKNPIPQTGSSTITGKWSVQDKALTESYLGELINFGNISNYNLTEIANPRIEYNSSINKNNTIYIAGRIFYNGGSRPSSYVYKLPQFNSLVFCPKESLPVWLLYYQTSIFAKNEELANFFTNCIYKINSYQW
jgi:hypothetical protein